MIDTVLHGLYGELYAVTHRMDDDVRQIIYLNRKIKERKERVRKQIKTRVVCMKKAQYILEQDEMDEVIRNSGG